MTDPLREALSRQCDNMAFVVNHVGLPQQWAEKFTRELEEDRARLSQAGAGGVVVKPLEWRKYRNGDEEAVTPFGTIYTAYASGYWRTNKAPKFVAAGKDVASAKAGAQASWDDEVRKLIASAALAALAPSAGEPATEPPYRPLGDLLDWAGGRWEAEVKNRPLGNIHRRALDTTWRQVIRKLGGDPEALFGPAHDDLVDATPPATPEPVSADNIACRGAAEIAAEQVSSTKHVSIPGEPALAGGVREQIETACESIDWIAAHQKPGVRADLERLTSSILSALAPGKGEKSDG